MSRYTVLIGGQHGAYGIVFPQLSGCAAMGASINQALTNAADALRDWAEVIFERGRSLPEPLSPESPRADPEVREALAGGATLSRSR